MKDCEKNIPWNPHIKCEWEKTSCNPKDKIFGFSTGCGKTFEMKDNLIERFCAHCNREIKIMENDILGEVVICEKNLK